MESSLREALERQEFLLYFQPQVDLSNGEIIGFEALLRWHRPEIGLISPAEFIPLAEETGLILPIGEWVLRTACAQNVAWQQAGFSPMRIAVNLSARQFHRDNFADTVTRALNETGMAPEYLELEITESILMGKETSILQMLRKLTDMGIQLSIDDFGTGYSSLAYLRRFPIAKLKVDQLFIRNLTTDPNDAVIARTVVGMAHSLHLKALAEGVETEAQLAYLRSVGCDQMQGYLFSRPLPAQEATKLLAQKKRL
ncbi:MAG: EAL domain-containing protein [Candidatus Manganitrophus sp.]|nr:EAL domain-containing protein [Candidatus Manganitrophus sp.]